MKFVVKGYFVFLFLFVSCSEDGGEVGGGPTTSFDREAMLINWADNIIIPSYEAFYVQTQELEAATKEFTSNPTVGSLAVLRETYADSYLQFQTVAMFEIGKAESVNYRARLNTYPTSVTSIEEKINTGTFNLELPSSFKEQGFPAIDYLLYGMAETDAEIVENFTTNSNAEAYKNYLNSVTESINSLTGEVLTNWTSSYREIFVGNTSSSSTGSVDKLTNDFIMYYEKYLRSGKIGIPSGIFTGNPVPQNVEAYYSGFLSKDLYLKSFETVQNFFNGKHFNSSQRGLSYNDYLDFLNTIKNGENLNALINNQFDAIKAQALNLDQNFVTQIQTNNNGMLAAFDELQKNVVLLKVDMMQALSISVDYVDSDGD